MYFTDKTDAGKRNLEEYKVFKDTSSSEEDDFSEYEQLNPNTIIKPLTTKTGNIENDVKRSPPPMKEKPRTPPKPMRRTTKSKSQSLDQVAMEAADSVSKNAKENKRMERESKSVDNSGKKLCLEFTDSNKKFTRKH